MNLKLTLLRLAVLTISSYLIPCSAQTGTVTFYSYTPTLKQSIKLGLIPAGSRVAFNGWLFDGDKRIAHASRGRFMTLRLTAGAHEFSVPYKGSGPEKPQLHLAIETGHHYCVRLSARVLTPVPVPVAIVTSRIDELACPDAVKEAANYKPLDLKRIEPAARPNLEASPTFPTN